MKRLFAILTSGLFLGGCIASHFSSTLNLRYAGMQYQRILVKFVDFQPDLARAGEQAVQSQIAKVVGDPVQCYANTQIAFPPGGTRQQMQAETWKYEFENKIDAILVCVNARRIQGSEQNKDMYCRLELFDLRTNQSVWYSQDTLDTNSILYGFKDMIHRFAQEAVEDLNAKGLLGVDNRSPFNPGTSTVSPGTNL